MCLIQRHAGTKGYHRTLPDMPQNRVGIVRTVKRVSLLLIALAGSLAACGSGGPSQAVQVACAPFQRLTLPTSPPTVPGESIGSAQSLPTKWVNQLLRSGNGELTDDAKIFASGRANNRIIGEIQSECRNLGA
jgi:hypothetical protein